MSAFEIFELIGGADERYLEHSEWTAEPRHRAKPLRVLIAAAIIAALLCAAALAAAGALDLDFAGLIRGALAGRGDDVQPAQLEQQLSEGQWVYLNGENIAVIVPEAPLKILLSDDSGESWRESTVEGSDTMQAFGDVREQCYLGGWIGAFGEDGMYLALTGGSALGSQPLNIYLSDDSGASWRVIETPHTLGLYSGVVAGAAFSSAESGTVCYRYWEDAGPVVWHTAGGGASWARAELPVPPEYAGCCFMPGVPSFDGAEGRLVINAEREGRAVGEFAVLTHDGGESWALGSIE